MNNELRVAATNLLERLDELMPLFEGAIKRAWGDGDYVNGPGFGADIDELRRAIALAGCDQTTPGEEEISPDLVFAVARAMKPRLFDPNICAEDSSSLGALIARDHIFDQARAAIRTVLDWQQGNGAESCGETDAAQPPSQTPWE